MITTGQFWSLDFIIHFNKDVNAELLIREKMEKEERTETFPSASPIQADPRNPMPHTILTVL